MASLDQDEVKLTQDFLLQHKAEDPVGNTKNWKLLLTASEIDCFNDYLARQINVRFAGQPVVITTILKGAVYFAVDLTRKLTIPYSMYFIEASSYHDSQTQNEEVELLSKIVPSKFEGKKVILIDELFDNGATLAKVKAKLLETPGLTITEKDVFTCTLFQKDKKTSHPSPDLVGYSRLPDLWVVGYGLDDAQEKRGWQHLFALPKCEGAPLCSYDSIFSQTPEGEESYIQLRARIRADVEAIKSS